MRPGVCYQLDNGPAESVRSVDCETAFLFEFRRRTSLEQREVRRTAELIGCDRGHADLPHRAAQILDPGPQHAAIDPHRNVAEKPELDSIARRHLVELQRNRRRRVVAHCAIAKKIADRCDRRVRQLKVEESVDRNADRIVALERAAQYLEMFDRR